MSKRDIKLRVLDNINYIGIGFFIGMFWAYFTVYGLTGVFVILKDWQTLTAGVIAIMAALIGATAIREQTDRHLNAQEGRLKNEKKTLYQVPLRSLNNTSLNFVMATEGETTEVTKRILNFGDFRNILNEHEPTFRMVGPNLSSAITFFHRCIDDLYDDPSNMQVRSLTNRLSGKLYQWSQNAIKTDNYEDFEFGSLGVELTSKMVFQEIFPEIKNGAPPQTPR